MNNFRLAVFETLVRLLANILVPKKATKTWVWLTKLPVEQL